MRITLQNFINSDEESYIKSRNVGNIIFLLIGLQQKNIFTILKGILTKYIMDCHLHKPILPIDYKTQSKINTL